MAYITVYKAEHTPNFLESEVGLVLKTAQVDDTGITAETGIVVIAAAISKTDPARAAILRHPIYFMYISVIAAYVHSVIGCEEIAITVQLNPIQNFVCIELNVHLLERTDINHVKTTGTDRTIVVFITMSCPLGDHAVNYNTLPHYRAGYCAERQNNQQNYCFFHIFVFCASG